MHASALTSHQQEKAGAPGVTGPKCWAQIWSGGGSELSAFLSNTEPTVPTAPSLKYSGLGCCFCVSQVSFIKATSRTACRVSARVIWLGGKRQPGRCSLFPLPCILCSLQGAQLVPRALHGAGAHPKPSTGPFLQQNRCWCPAGASGGRRPAVEQRQLVTSVP